MFFNTPTPKKPQIHPVFSRLNLPMCECQTASIRESTTSFYWASARIPAEICRHCWHLQGVKRSCSFHLMFGVPTKYYFVTLTMQNVHNVHFSRYISKEHIFHVKSSSVYTNSVIRNRRPTLVYSLLYNTFSFFSCPLVGNVCGCFHG